MTHDIICANCGTKLGERVDESMRILRFPQDMANSFALLAGGLGATICPHCDEILRTGMHDIVVGHLGQVVIGLQDHAPPAVEHKVRAGLGPVAAEAQIARGAREFRTMLVGVLIQPVAQAMNAFAAADKQFDWVADHVDELGPEFFQMLYLMGSGAVPLYTTPMADGHSPDTRAFVRDEQAPDAARHVVRRKEARDHHALTTARLVVLLLAYFAQSAIEARSLAPLAQDLPAKIPAIALAGEVLAAAAGNLGELVERCGTEGRGWRLCRYIHEAAWALLCHAHKVTNPRIADWTKCYVTYDASRRLDGNGEELIPPLEVLRATLDRPLFWQLVRQVGRSVSGETDEAQRNRQRGALLEAAGHVYPDELVRNVPVEYRAKEDIPDEQVEQQTRDLLRQWLGTEHELVRMPAILAGLARERPHLVAPLASRLVEADDPPLDDSTRLRLLRCAIEHLNRNGQLGAALQLADKGLAFLGGGEGDGDEALADVRSRFINERGNCLRYRGKLEEAMECYVQAGKVLGTGLDDADQRVLQGNVAIVLRDLHRYPQAIEIFAKLQQYADPAQRRGFVVSHALCLMEMGQLAHGLALMEQNTNLLGGATVQEHDVVEYCTLMSALRAYAGRLDEARELLEQMQDEARRRNYHLTGLLLRELALRGVQPGVAPTDEQLACIDTQCELLAALQGKQLGAMVLSAVRSLDSALVATQQHERAEALLRVLVESGDPAVSPRAWILSLMAARHAERRGDLDEAARDLDAALFDFQVGIDGAVASGDVHSFASLQWLDARELAARSLALSSSDQQADQRRWRHAADALAAPVLSSRLRRSAGLAPALDEPDEEDARLGALLDGPAAAVLQVVATGDDIVVLRTTRDDLGRLHTQPHRLGVAPDEATRIARVLSFHLMRADPQAVDLGLDQVVGWPQLAPRIRGAFAGLDPERPIRVVAGLLQEPSIVLALAGSHSVGFLPSLAAAVALHARGAATAHVRPRTLFGFAVWFDRERADEAAALATVTGEVDRLAASHGLQVRHVAGVQGTREQLLSGLADSDATWIACHGHVRREAESVDLLVAAQGRLPPADLRRTAASRRDEHVVGWQSMAALKGASRFVLSSACDSGLTLVNPGGERLGLERALFPAGTAAFVAPLWPVPTVHIQVVAARLMDAWLAAPRTPLAVHLRRVRNDCIGEGVPPLAADALAVFGDLSA